MSKLGNEDILGTLSDIQKRLDRMDDSMKTMQKDMLSMRRAQDLILRRGLGNAQVAPRNLERKLQHNLPERD